jgi:hypothetical protein
VSTVTETTTRFWTSLEARLKINDPLMDALWRKMVSTGLALAAIVVTWLLVVNLVAGQLVLRSASSGPGRDLVLQAASESINEVVKFANSTEPLAQEASPKEAYPAAIEVAPLDVARNPFTPLVVAPAQTGTDLGELIRQKQAAAPEPITIRAIVSRGGVSLAVLARAGTTTVVKPGDTFADWQVLAVGRDQVQLKKNGKTRTIVWEGSK